MAFGRLERTPGARPMADINMTPLIDVMLVLLVIFIVTAPLLGSRLALELPATGGSVPSAAATAPMHVALDAQGQLFLGDQPSTLEALSAAAVAAAQANAETEVLLRADRQVPYGRVAEVIARVQQAGLVRIGFVTEAAPSADRAPR